MGTPVVVVTSGGLPVTEATNGFGTPIEVAANGFGMPVQYVSKFGLPVVTGGGIIFAAVTSKAGDPLASSAGVPLDTGAIGQPAYIADFWNGLTGAQRTQMSSAVASLLFA